MEAVIYCCGLRLRLQKSEADSKCPAEAPKKRRQLAFSSSPLPPTTTPPHHHTTPATTTTSLPTSCHRFYVIEKRDECLASDGVFTMASREGANPLRPYYVPHAGLSPDSVNATHASSRATIGGSARDLLLDLDYSDYLDASPSLSDGLRGLVDRAVWRYSSTLLAQPFDVAKTLLQIYVAPGDEEFQDVVSASQQEEDSSDEVCMSTRSWPKHSGLICHSAGLSVV